MKSLSGAKLAMHTLSERHGRKETGEYYYFHLKVFNSEIPLGKPRASSPSRRKGGGAWRGRIFGAYIDVQCLQRPASSRMQTPPRPYPPATPETAVRRGAMRELCALKQHAVRNPEHTQASNL